MFFKQGSPSLSPIYKSMNSCLEVSMNNEINIILKLEGCKWRCYLMDVLFDHGFCIFIFVIGGC